MAKKKSPIQRAVGKFGSPSKFAAALGGDVLRQHVEHWLKAGRVPERHVRPIHELCGADPACWDFCPTDWHRIWPELVKASGAPAITSRH